MPICPPDAVDEGLSKQRRKEVTCQYALLQNGSIILGISQRRIVTYPLLLVRIGQEHSGLESQFCVDGTAAPMSRGSGLLRSRCKAEAGMASN